MHDPAVEYKRRFDEVYRTLLVIGPILAFSFTNYGTSPTFRSFVYSMGFPLLVTSILLWAVAHLLHRRWEYQIKIIGYCGIWFTSFTLFAIVYVERTPFANLWYFSSSLGTILLMAETGRRLVYNGVLTRNWALLGVLEAALLSLIAILILE